MCLEMRLQSFQVTRSNGLLMLGIGLFLVGGEEGLDEESAP